MRVDRQKLTKNCDFSCAGATLSHEMRVDAQKLTKNCDFTCAGATLSHEMRVDRQKLRKNCDFTCAGATLSYEMMPDADLSFCRTISGLTKNDKDVLVRLAMTLHTWSRIVMRCISSSRHRRSLLYQ